MGGQLPDGQLFGPLGLQQRQRGGVARSGDARATGDRASRGIDQVDHHEEPSLREEVMCSYVSEEHVTCLVAYERSDSI